jgi:hypothetical protein
MAANNTTSAVRSLTVHAELGWLESVVPGGRTRDDGRARAHLDVVE